MPGLKLKMFVNRNKKKETIKKACKLGKKFKKEFWAFSKMEQEKKLILELKKSNLLSMIDIAQEIVLAAGIPYYISMISRISCDQRYRRRSKLSSSREHNNSALYKWCKIG